MHSLLAPVLLLLVGTHSATAALTNCQKSIIQQLTNTFENSQKNFAFDYCDDIHDGRGYTVGVVGFTTSTKDALDVIQTYTESSNYQNEFDDSLPRLLELNSTLSGETSGLKGFCRAWYKASSNPTFRAIQIAKADELYYNPSQTFADELALELPTSRGQMYDAAVQMGIESDPDSLPSMLKRVPRTSDMSEEEWLTAFLAERERTLCHATQADTQQAWCDSTTRVKSYQYLVSNKQLDFSESLKPLDNDGKVMNLECDLDIWTKYVPGPEPKEGSRLSGGAIGGIVIAIVVVGCIAGVIFHRMRRSYRERKQKGNINF